MEFADYWEIVAASTWFLGLAIGGALVFGLFVLRERRIRDQFVMLVEDRNELQLEVDKMDLELASKANELETAGQNVTAIGATLRARERELNHKNDELDSLLKTFQTLAATLETSEQDLLTRVSNLKASAAASDSLKLTLDGRNHELTSAQGELARSQEELETVRQAKGAVDQELREHMSELETLRAEMARWMAERNSEVGSLRGEMYRLQAEREAAVSRAAGLQNELEVTKQALDDTNEKFNGLIGQLTEVAREREQFRGRVLELEAAVSARKLAAGSSTVVPTPIAPTPYVSPFPDQVPAVPAPSPARNPVLQPPVSPAFSFDEDDTDPDVQSFEPPQTRSRTRGRAATSSRAAKPRAKNADLLAACPQHLEDVKGIGPTFAKRLYEAGIGSFWQLGQMSSEELGLILELDSMQEDTVDLDAIREEAMQLATETGSVGRVWNNQSPDDLGSIEGLGKTYAKRLYDAGICTYEALANSTPETLDGICQPPSFRKPDYDLWIENAKELVEGTAKPKPVKKKTRRKGAGNFDISLQ